MWCFLLEEREDVMKNEKVNSKGCGCAIAMLVIFVFLVIVIWIFGSDSDESSVSIDFSKIETSLDQSFKSSDQYWLYDSCDLKYDEESNDLTITLALNSSISPDAVIPYAKYAISTINYEAQRQDTNLKDYSESDGYYGGLFDAVDAFLIVAPSSAQTDDDCYIYESIPKGSNREVELQ